MYTCSLPAGSSLSSFVMSDVFEFSFRSSAADVVLLSLVRCVILFRCFAYRYQTSTASLFTSRCVSGISLLYLAFKLAFAASALRLLLVSEGALVLTQLVVYWLVRRRRIEYDLTRIVLLARAFVPDSRISGRLRRGGSAFQSTTRALPAVPRAHRSSPSEESEPAVSAAAACRRSLPRLAHPTAHRASAQRFSRGG